MALRSDDFSINTVIGEGSTVSGDLRINGSVRLDGDVRGDLDTDGNVQIGERARLCGNLTAKSAIVGGIVLLSSAAVIGDIISQKVRIEEKVIFHGHCISIEDEAKYLAASERYLEAKAIRTKAAFA